ncbi:hypothetical protein Droror1_Dr00001000 [Drosera rotundifolia]
MYFFKMIILHHHVSNHVPNRASKKFPRCSLVSLATSPRYHLSFSKHILITSSIFFPSLHKRRPSPSPLSGHNSDNAPLSRGLAIASGHLLLRAIPPHPFDHLLPQNPPPRRRLHRRPSQREPDRSHVGGA